MRKSYWENLKRDLEAPVEVRRFGTGWLSGFFAILLAVIAIGLVAALRWPNWFAMPELDILRTWGGLRALIHATLLASYALSILSLLLWPRKVLGITALMIALAASLLGGAAVQPQETADWGIFFGVDFFIVNMIATGVMLAPLERALPHNAGQRLFRHEWREDLFYFLVSSMFVQLISFLALAPSSHINATWTWLDGARATISALPWLIQFALAMLLTDLVQYWFHRAFHRVPFLWGFHAVHHSTTTMDWLAGARLHFVEIVLQRAVTSLPLLTLGFLPSVMQAYIGVVYVYASLIHANVKGDFNRMGKWFVVPRYHHWHHALESEATDKNFAVHFPFLDRVFGTHFFPDSRWPEAYGVPEAVPKGYIAQLKYPLVRGSG